MAAAHAARKEILVSPWVCIPQEKRVELEIGNIEIGSLILKYKGMNMRVPKLKLRLKSENNTLSVYNL